MRKLDDDQRDFDQLLAAANGTFGNSSSQGSGSGGGGGTGGASGGASSSTSSSAESTARRNALLVQISIALCFVVLCSVWARLRLQRLTAPARATREGSADSWSDAHPPPPSQSATSFSTAGGECGGGGGGGGKNW